MDSRYFAVATNSFVDSSPESSSCLRRHHHHHLPHPRFRRRTSRLLYRLHAGRCHHHLRCRCRRHLVSGHPLVHVHLVCRRRNELGTWGSRCRFWTYMHYIPRRKGSSKSLRAEVALGRRSDGADCIFRAVLLFVFVIGTEGDGLKDELEAPQKLGGLFDVDAVGDERLRYSRDGEGNGARTKHPNLRNWFAAPRSGSKTSRTRCAARLSMSSCGTPPRSRAGSLRLCSGAPPSQASSSSVC